MRCTTQAFLSHFTNDSLTTTTKCTFHGDKESGLEAHANLMKLLKITNFQINGVSYSYDSIGVACNSSYDPVSHRKGNDFESRSSHFEIKFLKQSETALSKEYLCLNIHLTNEADDLFGKEKAIERLTQGINLFYAELGLNSPAAAYRLKTKLQSAMSVTLDNFEARGFSCRHEESLEVLENYRIAKQYRAC